jgi:RHS repeat-associated protein
MNNTGGGTSTIVARHDYLPFGEEIYAGVGLRTATQKYAVTDKVRQRYALTERDEATGLDHTWFRKYEGFAGRWTTPDPYPGTIGNPQTLNRYTYGNHDPINSVDPTGLRDDICGYDESGPIYCGNDEPPIRTFTNERGPSLSEYLWILNSSFGGFTGGGGGGGGTPGNPVEPEDDAADDKGNAMSSAIEYKNFATSSRSEQMNSSKTNINFLLLAKIPSRVISNNFGISKRK